MIRTYATDTQVLAVAKQFVAQQATPDQAYRWLRQHAYTIRDRYYRATAVLAQMQLLTQSK